MNANANLPEGVEEIQTSVQAKYPGVMLTPCARATNSTGWPCYRVVSISDNAEHDFYVIDTEMGRCLGDDWGIEPVVVADHESIVQEIFELIEVDPKLAEAYGPKPVLGPGDRIRLISMGTDPRPVAPGTLGKVQRVTDHGDWTQVEVNWEDGRQLMMSLPEDKYELVDANPYPLRDSLQELVGSLTEQMDSIGPGPRQQIRRIIETMGEYEHGTADVEDISSGLTLQQVHDVYQDIILTLLNWVEA